MARTFKEAWAEKEAEGYQYGADALEGVRFGWDMHAAETPPGLTRAQAIAVMDQVLGGPAPRHMHARRAWLSGVKTLLRALTEAGAFTDGKNWGDRIPVPPGETLAEEAKRLGDEYRKRWR